MRKGSNHAKTTFRTTELASRGNDYPYYYRIGLSGVARPAEEPADDGAKRCRTGSRLSDSSELYPLIASEGQSQSE